MYDSPVCFIAHCGNSLSQIPIFRREGFGNRIRRLGFWLELLFAELFAAGMLMLLFMDFAAPLTFRWIRLLAVALSSVFFAAALRGIAHIRSTRSVLATVLIAVTVALFLEGTVFNFRFWQSHEYEPIDVTDELRYSYKLVKTGERENEYKPNGTSPYVELRNLDTKVYNIYLDITARNTNDRVVNTYVDVYMTDESNENYLKLPAQTVMTEVESTKYLYLMTNGESDDLRFVISSDYGKTFQVNSVRLNVPQAFNFSLLRLAVVALLIFLFRMLRPSSRLWSYSFTDSAKQRTVTTVVVVLEIALLLMITVLNPAFSGNPSRHTAQYQELAEAFLDGRLYLDTEPAEFLAEMENPYDYTERVQQASQNKSTYYWDAAYFNGRYYVYFGVLPVLLLYLPYHALTGLALPNVIAIQIFLAFFTVGSFLLIGEVLKKYFRSRRIPYLSYLILSLIFVNASGGVFIAKRPDFYSVPILAALALTVFGLYFWLRSDRGDGRIRPFSAGIGSLCMALVAGCRPQLLLVSFMAVVIFWSAVFKERTLFSRKGWKATLALILPYVLVAAGIMWYNNARFGSPFDFGANYNLTTNDMTGRGFRVERVGLSLFTYFFQFPNFTAAFPFLSGSAIATNYLGTTITEPMFGGIFIVIPILWLLFLIPSRTGAMKKKGILAWCLVPVALSLCLGVFDAQGAGLLQRYVCDFAFLACLSAVVMAFFLYDRSLGAEKKRLHSFLRFALYASGVYCFCCIFAKYSVEIFYRNPYLFHTVSELVQFW
ncbi:MAG: hypothetical protein E7668_07410 [Ruminococcaceae bacterium]|nr:hypothetical protein [Oscillospiraceae bacterium]